MIKEAYCSFEVAKLLKEKGFNTSCMGRYSIRSKEFHLDCTKMCSNGGLFDCAAPTHQMAMKWLREKYYIYADPIKQGNYNDCSEYYTWIVARMGIIHRNSSVGDKLSYEQAVEAALKYSLENLI